MNIIHENIILKEISCKNCYKKIKKYYHICNNIDKNICDCIVLDKVCYNCIKNKSEKDISYIKEVKF